MPAPHFLFAGVQNKRVSLIHGLDGDRYLHQFQRFGVRSFDTEKERRFDSRFHFVESTVHSSIEVLESSSRGKAFDEFVRLFPFHLSMLHRSPSEKFVQFYHFVRCCTILVLRRLGSDPNVDIVPKSLTTLALVRLQHNIRVAPKELAVLVFGPSLYLKIFNPPYENAFLLSAPFPRRFGLCCRSLYLAIKIRSDCFLGQKDKKKRTECT